MGMELPYQFSRLIKGGFDFDEMALSLWNWQREKNEVIGKFAAQLNGDGPEFLPIEVFRRFKMICEGAGEPAFVFESSGTTSETASRHWITDPGIYRESLLHGYHAFYGDQDKLILALLPNYLERGNSSLVHMVKVWMDEFGLPGSGFYLDNFTDLEAAILQHGRGGEDILLIGVTYALLDFTDRTEIKMPPGSIVMETGGMKGRRKEMVRDEVHATLRRGLGVDQIHSEYGMTELLSQAYSSGNGIFRCPPWMKVVITDPWLPRMRMKPGHSGRINIIDLANIWSCGFIATDDIGRMYADGSFEILGRLDHAEMRGCNLMYEPVI